MKIFVIYIVLATITFFVWVTTGTWEYNRELYISNKVLDNSIPFDVRIDEELLKSLTPADESSGSSPEGF